MQYAETNTIYLPTFFIAIFEVPLTETAELSAIIPDWRATFLRSPYLMQLAASFNSLMIRVDEL